MVFGCVKLDLICHTQAWDYFVGPWFVTTTNIIKYDLKKFMLQSIMQDTVRLWLNLETKEAEG